MAGTPRTMSFVMPWMAVAAAGPTISLLVPRVGDPDPRWPQVARDGRIVWPLGAHGVAPEAVVLEAAPRHVRLLQASAARNTARAVS